MTITRQTMQQIRERLEDALQGVSDDMGLQITVGRGSFGNDNATFKLNIATTNEDGTANNKEATDYLSLCGYDSRFNKEWLNSTVDFRGTPYTLVGHKTRASKYPFVVSSGNKTFKMTEAQLLLYFG